MHAVIITVESLKARQKPLRRQITMTCQQIDNMILTRESRRETRSMLERVFKLMKQANSIDEQLSSAIDDDAELDRQISTHMAYLRLHERTAEAVDNYMAERAEYAASVISHAASSVRASQQRLTEAHQQAEQESVAAQLRLATAQQEAEEARLQADAARARADSASEQLDATSGDPGSANQESVSKHAAGSFRTPRSVIRAASQPVPLHHRTTQWLNQ